MKRLLLIAVAAVAITGNASAQGTTQHTVFPYGLENQNGSRSLTELQSPTDAQHWFAASYLSQVWTTPVLISEVAFRVNEQNTLVQNYNATIPRVEIWLTTSSRLGQFLSASFAINAGPDARAVYASDNVVLSSPGGPGPNPFGLRFQFSEPFRFDPSAGHLLMRVRTIGSSEFFGGWHIDAHSVGSAVAVMRDNDAFQTPIGISVVTQFGWSAVPEPSVGAMLWPGVVWLLARRRKGLD